jgi:hypothetical protein
VSVTHYPLVKFAWSYTCSHCGFLGVQSGQYGWAKPHPRSHRGLSSYSERSEQVLYPNTDGFSTKADLPENYR